MVDMQSPLIRPKPKAAACLQSHMPMVGAFLFTLPRSMALTENSEEFKLDLSARTLIVVAVYWAAEDVVDDTGNVLMAPPRRAHQPT